MITYISITVGDIKTKLFLLKTNVLKFTLQNFKRKNQRNKRFIKLFTNVQYASPWLHGTHRNGVPFLILAQISVLLKFHVPFLYGTSVWCVL